MPDCQSVYVSENPSPVLPRESVLTVSTRLISQLPSIFLNCKCSSCTPKSLLLPALILTVQLHVGASACPRRPSHVTSKNWTFSEEMLAKPASALSWISSRPDKEWPATSGMLMTISASVAKNPASLDGFARRGRDCCHRHSRWRWRQGRRFFPGRFFPGWEKERSRARTRARQATASSTRRNAIFITMIFQ